ncbi:MAG TPA: DUF5615 family PIN-like protein [Blastocatellia bacterium]|nr:DUF5615 family PIN-like protein [Blastocatellia bacterium]
MARLFADENFPLPVVEALRQSGHDILTVHEAGLANQSIGDDAVLSFARADNRAVLTLNRKHFVRLHNAQVQHSGIIVCTFDPDLKDKLAAFIRPLKLRHNCWNNSFA